MLPSERENPARVEHFVHVPEGPQPSEGGSFPGGVGQERLSPSDGVRTPGEKLPVPLELRTEIALA